MHTYVVRSRTLRYVELDDQKTESRGWTPSQPQRSASFLVLLHRNGGTSFVKKKTSGEHIYVCIYI